MPVLGVRAEVLMAERALVIIALRQAELGMLFLDLQGFHGSSLPSPSRALLTAPCCYLEALVPCCEPEALPAVVFALPQHNTAKRMHLPSRSGGSIPRLPLNKKPPLTEAEQKYLKPLAEHKALPGLPGFSACCAAM